MALGGMRAGRQPRKQISSKLEKGLAAYMAAAVAAALVAAPESAEAKIIHSNTDIRVGFGLRQVEIDLNHDGIPDFVITGCPAYHSRRLIVGPKVAGNAIQLVPSSKGAAAGFRGTPNGPSNSFGVSSNFCSSTNGVTPEGLGLTSLFSYPPYRSVGGPWLNTTNRYLGLKFVINGQTHFGWARLSISDLAGHLTGYAYETVPNTPIIEGATSDIAALEEPAPLDSVSPSPSLGILARGVDALAIWRREHAPAANKREDPKVG
jgi:hypothetical protein